jgi:hypothetical protein
MAKNYADIYSSSNDSVALEQRWYAKVETTRGILAVPTNSDFFWTLGGGSISYAQPFESSPHRSGRHHTNIIKKKKETSFSFSTYFNIDETLGSASTTEIDVANRLFFKSLLGKEYTSPNLKYTSEAAPDLTFSLYEVGDKWARQSAGAFMQGGNMSFPGDGEATVEWSGNAKDAIFVGIGKSTVASSGNSITLETGEGDAFRVGAAVMIIKDDGVTRSTDTASGTARFVTAIAGDVITLSGAALTDADGSVNPIYLCYYEPAAPTGINNPVTGLVGSMNIVGLSMACFRSASINIQNNHEIVDYCYGTDGLASPFFVPGDRMTASISVEMNLNADIVRFFNRVQDFEAQDFTIVLGDAAGRHLELTAPNVRFSVPAFSLPDTGSVPISFEGNAYQSALDLADELTVEFK